MFPEQSQTLKNREKVASYRALLMIIASILSLLLPLIVQSILKDPERVKWWEPSGKIVLLFMPIIGLSFAIFGFFSIIITFFSIDESFHKTIPKYESKKLSISATFYQMSIPAKDKKYKKFLASSFLNSISARILGILIIPLLAYVLKFKGTDYFIYITVSFVCKFGWFFLFKKMLNKYDLVKSFYFCIAISAVVSFLELVFLITFLSYELKIVLFIISIGTILGTVYGINLFIAPITSAIVDEYAAEQKEENPETVVTKISGSYFGLHSFMLAIGQCIASIMVGIVLSGSNENNPIIITLSMASMGIFYVISLIYAKKIKLDKIDNKRL
jgi:Na+/melibiose symporter-like transporter